MSRRWESRRALRECLGVANCPQIICFLNPHGQIYRIPNHKLCRPLHFRLQVKILL
ncbi:hypothetical protein PUN4_550124 [Paraburkholderia unamae]|nr:hypothetical protein PUN4_550124 [Paraburkholderia unamae]